VLRGGVAFYNRAAPAMMKLIPLPALGILVTHLPPGHEVAAVVQTARTRGAADDSPVAVFTALRSWKNEFR
jgi:hypothetical protein